MQPPKPSKLELYLEILQAIETKKPAKLETIQKQTSLSETLLNNAVTFLQKQNLIEKRQTTDQPTYLSTQRGERLRKYFAELPCGTFFVLPQDSNCPSERYPE
ncbi:MAG: winged helix-turn-helix domain-containing protein [Candidatus Bathyarchaeia archaeon]|jgi:predicted transcriptional regulator